jgi:phage baseplate assembly protein V
MSYDLSEAYRKLASLIRFGTITGIDVSDATQPRVTCDCGGLETDLLPWHAMRAGGTKYWSAPTVGEQVIVFAPGGETSLGFVLGGFYSSDNPAPSTDVNVDMVQYPDGSTVTYDSNTHAMTVNVSNNGNVTVNVAGGTVTVNCKDATVNADDSVTLNTPKTHLTGDLTVDGNATVTKNLGVTGAMAVQGQGSSGAVSTFAGAIQITGGDVTADGIGLKSHHHTAQGQTAPTTAAQA